MKLYSDTKVYIGCPANKNSGGPELLHQLCSQLIQLGINASMLYTAVDSKFNPDDPVHDLYKKYHVPYTLAPENSERNVLIAPESMTYLLYSYKKTQRVFWWLSVDNYFKITINTILNRMANALSGAMPKIFYFDKADDDIEHWVQSEYARQFIKLNGIPENKIYIVEDYLRQDFLLSAAQIDLERKENFVAYNPKKGFEITRQLINLAPDISWRPIENMTPAQVQELLAKAKVYIDFGTHPGKDRIPREAAISGCVVITGLRGAAANSVDINIPDEFKFDERTANLNHVIEKIRAVFENFSAAYDKKADYRARILNDKNRFAAEVADAVNMKNLPTKFPTLIAQGFTPQGYIVASFLAQNQTQFKPAFITDNNSEMTGEAITKSHRNFSALIDGGKSLEIISRDDAKFLYHEGRIKKFMLFEPTRQEILALKKFYDPVAKDVMIIER